ncbi:helix-turn-helix domain-containing protein [Salipiger sp. PrR002]|uniref:helix-turn-helix domain-containing protein n=1 Tax=Salipiger sp. PrR002 TaxID=2706489 RepID=UPI0013B8E7F9|nr:helix-turn-helix domain-containing protein [Salipiger sp. PrR002]NDV97674.1 helix-turn-helix domain-containing protein [Salipiger sp. PrR002]NDW55165.1 helix-turn-helix domain-containing protein [Salipiger sp. PrR004]
MPRDTLTGSRIRERRTILGLKQADLARQAGISASYLNLIEHNRRRIGGKLLLDLAEILKVEPSILTEGAEAALIAALREAAGTLRGNAAELDRVDEFAGRFPGWARLLAEAHARVETLERSVETLSDRLAHDPQLAGALHEMLSTVTAIRSAATILNEPEAIDPDWQRRFHRNIHEDSARLAESSRSLVSYLEAEGKAARESGTPQEEVTAVFEAAGYHFPSLEKGLDPETLAEELGADLSGNARILLRQALSTYAEDALALPLKPLLAAVSQDGADPLALLQRFGCDPARAMRRLAALPAEAACGPVGLAICDASGALTFRKPLPDFPIPRFGADCPLWPLFPALSRPMAVLSRRVRLAGRQGGAVRAWAVAQPAGLPQANRDPIFEAHMMITPAGPERGGEETELVGATCRICPRAHCPARREPSLLGDAAEQAL